MHVLLLDGQIPKCKLASLSCRPSVYACNLQAMISCSVQKQVHLLPNLLWMAAAKGKIGLKRLACIFASQLHWTKDLVREAEEHLKTFVVPNHAGDGGRTYHLLFMHSSGTFNQRQGIPAE